jgi:carotenoid cleavage dioxygenase-like enzyme
MSTTTNINPNNIDSLSQQLPKRKTSFVQLVTTPKQLLPVMLALTLGIIWIPIFSPTKPDIIYRQESLIPSHKNFQHLFKTIQQETINKTQLFPIKGNIPWWIKGKYVKTSYCGYDNPQHQWKFTMVYDALMCGLIFEFNHGKLWFTSRMLRTDYYNQSNQHKPLYRTYSEIEPPRSFIERAQTMLEFRSSDNINLNFLLVHGGQRLFSLTNNVINGEVEWNMDTLESISSPGNNNKTGEGLFKNDNRQPFGNFISCTRPSTFPGGSNHHHRLFNFILNINFVNNLIQYGHSFVYYVYEFNTTQANNNNNNNSKIERQIIAQVPTSEFFYVHENVLTLHYFIIPECPLVWRARTIITTPTLLSALEFDESLGVRFKLVNIETKSIHEYRLPREIFCISHQIHSYESQDGQEIYLYVVTYDDMLYHVQNTFTINEFHIKNLFDIPPSTIRKITINIGTGHVFAERIHGYDKIDGEMMITSKAKQQQHLVQQQDRKVGHHHNVNSDDDVNFMYGITKSISHRDNECKSGYGCGGAFWDTISKIHIKTGKHVAHWRKYDHWPSEPIFIARPGGYTEDDGVILNIVLGEVNADRGGGPTMSFLYVLSAKDFSEIAIVPLLIPIPYQGHGLFYSSG